MIPFVYDSDSTDAWSAVLGRFPPSCADVYATSAYLNTWVHHESAEPRCLHFIHGDTELLYPFFIKPLPGDAGASGHVDIFSAYGYGGMIANRPSNAVDTTFLRHANAAIDTWCRDNLVVAEFIRENPVPAANGRYLRDVDHARVRQNVYALTNPGYTIPSRSARRNVALASRKGLTVQWDPEMTTMDRFAELYAGTADHGGWDAYYHFKKAYFQEVAEGLQSIGAIVNILRDSQLVAAAIVFFYGDHTTYHLSGSVPAARGDRPNDLMLHAILAKAQQRKAPVVSLGGGMSTASDDPLFHFKQRFGNRICDVHIGKKVHDAAVYKRACDRWEAEHPELADVYRHYLLKYRLGGSC